VNLRVPSRTLVVSLLILALLFGVVLVPASGHASPDSLVAIASWVAEFVPAVSAVQYSAIPPAVQFSNPFLPATPDRAPPQTVHFV